MDMLTCDHSAGPPSRSDRHVWAQRVLCLCLSAHVSGKHSNRHELPSQFPGVALITGLCVFGFGFFLFLFLATVHLHGHSSEQKNQIIEKQTGVHTY